MGCARARRLCAAAVLPAVLAIGVTAAAGETPGDVVPAQGANAVTADLVQDVGGRGAAASPQRYAYLRKLDGRLQAVAASRLGAGSTASAAVSAERQGVATSPGGDVAVD